MNAPTRLAQASARRVLRAAGARYTTALDGPGPAKRGWFITRGARLHCWLGATSLEAVDALRTTERYPRGTLLLAEVMPDYLVASHEAAHNWGVWPHNGAARLLVAVEDLDGTVTDNGYDHVVRRATRADRRAGYDLA